MRTIAHPGHRFADPADPDGAVGSASRARLGGIASDPPVDLRPELATFAVCALLGGVIGADSPGDASLLALCGPARRLLHDASGFLTDARQQQQWARLMRDISRPT